MIREDKNYLSKLDLLAIEKSIAKLDVFSLRIDREQYTEEEKAENVKIANSVSDKEWFEICNNRREITAQKIEKLMQELSERFVIYQYNKEDKIIYNSEDWDLFFWCNSSNGQRDYSYVTLNLNKNRTVEKKLQDVELVLSYMQDIGIEGLDINIQYTVTYNENKVKEIVLNYVDKIKNNTIELMGYKGKIKDVGIDYEGNKCYGFFKNRSRTRYYKLSYKNILEMAITA